MDESTWKITMVPPAHLTLHSDHSVKSQRYLGLYVVSVVIT